MTQLSKDEYLKASRGLATGFGATVDFADPQVGGTVQSENGIGDSQESLPGQLFSVDQLPDPAVAVAYGLPPQTIPEHLILDTVEDAEKHVQGKDGLDIINAELRDKLGNPMLTFDNQVASADDSLKHLADRTGTNAGTLTTTSDSTASGDQVKVDDTGSGRPIDSAGVQKSDAGGTDSVPTADGGAKGKETADGDDKVSGRRGR